MGLCASMLQRRAQKRYPEPRRRTPRPLFVVRGDHRPTNPEALVFRVRDSGRTQPAGKAETRSLAEIERCWQQGPGALDRMLCTQMPRLPCVGGATAVGVEPDGPASVSKTRTDRVAPPAPATPISAAMTPMRPGRCGTPAAPMTPGRPVWQRRILMGMRCELPRFSGLILYDEQGRRLQMGTPGRRNHRQGKKKTARTSASPTLRDLL
uniref:Uncharacterized protein n=1 Tax=Avena sativa TaxID=4498 RepID=A0ACD5WD41_AVESA